MTKLVLALFIVAWAAIAFGVIRALLIVWGLDRRIAIATAVAVAAAFVLGAISPFALPSRTTMAVQAPVAPVAPVADTSRAVVCPAGAVVGNKPAAGHLDDVAIGSAAPAPPGPSIVISSDEPVHLGGWIALDAGPAAAICAIVDGQVATATIRYGITRPDVAAALGKSVDAPSGFQVMVALKPGTHVVNVGAVEADGHAVDAIPGTAMSVQVH